MPSLAGAAMLCRSWPCSARWRGWWGVWPRPSHFAVPGQSWLPTVALIVSAFGLFVFRTHAWPGGPLTFGALALAAATIRSSHEGRIL